MNEQKILIKSKGRRVFKLILVLTPTIIFTILGIQKNNTDYYIFPVILMVVGYIEIVSYSQTTLELDNEILIAKRKPKSYLNKEDYIIKLKKIQSYIYQENINSSWALYQIFFWELFFPSGQSFLIINQIDGKQIKIQFDGNKKKLKKIMKYLPENIPNG